VAMPGVAAGTASHDTAAEGQEQQAGGERSMLFEGEPQDAETSQQELLGMLLELSWCTSASLALSLSLGSEGMQRLLLALAAAAGEADALQVGRLWESLIAAAQPFVAQAMQLAKEVQLQLQACGMVGLQQLSEDAEACSSAMQLLQSMRQLGAAAADMQRGSLAVPPGSGRQFSAAALSSRMTAHCSETHAALASCAAELLQLGAAAMPLSEEALARVQAGTWQELEAAAGQCLLGLGGLAGAMSNIKEYLKQVGRFDSCSGLYCLVSKCPVSRSSMTCTSLDFGELLCLQLSWWECSLNLCWQFAISIATRQQCSDLACLIHIAAHPSVCPVSVCRTCQVGRAPMSPRTQQQQQQQHVAMAPCQPPRPHQPLLRAPPSTQCGQQLQPARPHLAAGTRMSGGPP
jgi:hypothetical protein